jgi:hypothetical protein
MPPILTQPSKVIILLSFLWQCSMAPLRVYSTIQSQHTDFSAWISMLTLCLTPLAVHIFAGAPEPTVLRDPKPPWHDRICHLNPTSIFWRYYVITIRRFSTRCWEPDDMAATNAIFWTGSNWVGSEEIMIISSQFCTRRPSDTRIPLMSGSAMKTLLVTIQGIQAMYGLVKGLTLGGYALKVALPNIFLPLALAGLYRLPASLWLTEEYGYRRIDSSDASFLAKLDTSKPIYSQKNWRVILVKISFLGTLTVLCTLSIYYFKPNPRITSGTASTLLINLFYTIFLFVTLVPATLYTARGRCNTTIIPCISSTWYRIYTYFLFLFALLLLIVSALETRSTSCGDTTYPAKLGLDHFLC